MITVKIKTILDLKKIIGAAEVMLSIPYGSTLEELLAAMAKKWGNDLSSRLFEPQTTKPSAHIRLMINGRDIAFLNRFKTVIREGDEILILPPVSGG